MIERTDNEDPMSDEPIPSPEQLTRQARQHLDSLRAAGVEWLPDAAPPIFAARTSSPEPAAVQKGLPLVDDTPTPEVAALTVEQRREALAALAQRVSQCTRCTELAARRTQTVFGVGALDPELCFVGEAPG